MKAKKIILSLFLILILVISCSKEDQVENQNENQIYTTGLLERPSNYDQFPTSGSPVTGSYPSSFFLNMPPAGDQGTQPSCTAWAVGYGMQSYFRKNEFNYDYDNNTYCSPSFIYNQIKVGSCIGGSHIHDALNLLKNQGVCSLQQMNYDQNFCNILPNQQQLNNALDNKLSSWGTVPINVVNIKSKLLEDKPVVIAAHLNNGFKYPIIRNGHKVWYQLTGQSTEYHAMVVSGWDDSINSFKVLNSHGLYGATQNLENGYIWIDYSMFNGQIIDQAYYGENDNNQNSNYPALILPYNISNNISNPINFSWEDISNATGYRIQISTNLNNWSAQNGFQSGIIIDLNSSSNSYNWSNAQNNTTYYWSVKSIYSGGSSNYAQPYQFTVSNNTNNASIDLSTSNIAFGNANVGVSSSQNFTITNNGNSPLIINNISSNNPVFNCNYSGTINGGSSQQVTVTFSPNNSQNYSGQLTVNSNSTNGNNTINLSGTGITVASNPIINISPISLNFGNVNVGSSSSQNITIQNIGNAPLIINNISSTNAYYFCGYSGTISAGSSIQTAVSFNPSSIGTLNSQLSVSSNATSGNNTISLSGVGTTSTSCNPIGNPSIGNYNTCESSSVVCNQARGIIKSRVVNVNCSANQITFEIRKCDGTTFNSSGIFYITNGTCTASVYGSVSFSSGQSTYQITINDNNMTGTKTYYGLIEQSAGQSICPPIQISY